MGDKAKTETNYYLIINLGLRSIRVILFDQYAHKLEHNWYPVRTNIHHEKVEQDPNEWWELCLKLLKETLDLNQSYKKNLRTITVTSSAACLVVLDASGKPLGNALMVSDKRAHKQAEELASNPKIKNIFNNRNFLATPSYAFPKILWLKKHEPQIYKKARYFMSPNDFFIYKLTGEIVTDPLNAEKFYYDALTKQYAPEILKYTKIVPNMLPRVVPFGHTAGKLSLKLQKQLDLPSTVKVVVSTYDAICAFLGSGTASEGEVCNVCGTVSSIRAYTQNHVVSSKPGILCQLYDNFKIVGGSNNIDGGLLEWSKNMFYGDSYPEKYIYNIMEDEAKSSPVGAHGLIFSPYLIGERLPFFDNEVRGIFFGLERFHTRKDLIRSVLEASGFMAADILNHIEESGIKIKQMRMSGGLAQNHLAARIRADIIGKPVLVIDEIETTALGALFILLVADGVYSSFNKTAELVKINQTFYPDPGTHKKYKHFFNLFKHVYHNNKELMKHRKKIISQIYDTSPGHLLDNL